MRLSDRSLAGSYLPGLLPARQVSWSRGGDYLAVAAGDRSIRVGSPITQPDGNWVSTTFPNPVMSVAFSPTRDVLPVAAGTTLSTLAIEK